jgi:hypothetical protein
MFRKQNIIKKLSGKSYKNYFFLALFSSFLILSCTKKNKKIPESNGNTNSVSIIIDNQLWDGEIGDSIRNKFATPVIGLPQEEPIFTINQYPVKLLEGFMNNSRNIIIIKKEPKSRFEIIENEYAKPQIVTHISGNTVQEILDTIENNSEKIIGKINLAELEEIQKKTKLVLLKTKKIKSKFGIILEVPKTYKFVMRKQKFIWLKKEIPSGSNSILIYQVPLFEFKNNKKALNNILKIRDSISNLYIHGSFANTRMVTENYIPYSKNMILNNLKTIEIKGNWEMENDNMSGPFINYTIQDKRHKRMLILEGFCYAPSKEKRDLMLELEATIKSIKF